MKKIAFINQRYGKEVAGGSESYTRAVAEHLAKAYGEQLEIEVLTSKALDYVTWQDSYSCDEEMINGIKVRRFGVKHKRSRVFQRGPQILMQYLGIHWKWLEELRLRARGPYVPALVEYIKEHKDEYDAFIFVTYLYYPAYFGAKEVYEKAFFIPTAHDEEPIYMNIYRDLFCEVKGLIYLTPEEKNFVEKTFHNESLPNQVIGMGIEVPADADEMRFREKYGIDGDYLLFAGRIEENKGCKELIDYFIRFQEEHRQKLTLVLMGKTLMDIPDREDIRYVGFVSEQDKYDGMKGAKVICLPSKYESFSISLLEGMAYGVPALVNEECDVLKGHMQRSGGGFGYHDYASFRQGLEKLTECDEVYEEMALKAGKYVREQYDWKRITERFAQMIGLEK